MKAAVYDRTGGPEVFRYDEVPDPELRPGGVIVEVQAVGVQGGDLLHRQRGEIPSVPHIVGYQAAGVVREVGDAVEGLAVGQPVVATMPAGSHAELVSLPAMSVWPLPEGLSVREAAAVPIEFATAHDCLFEFGHLQSGETVLIQAGASGVGLAAIQLAKRAGATVLATASSDDRLARLADFGLDHGINYRDADFVEVARDLTGGRGVDLVVDSVGSTLADSIRALAYRGRCTLVGQAGRDPKPFDASMLMLGNQTLTGVFF
ncbi:MAG: quinone oxidoreductase family protein, partial [Acidimicrobiales bacterium]